MENQPNGCYTKSSLAAGDPLGDLPDPYT